MKAIVLGGLLGSSLAWAQPKTADDWYKEGENQYTLGDFEKAVAAFKQGFQVETSESKKSAYIYNIAQSYRQMKDCSNAQFFYKRYLALKAEDTAKPLAPQKKKEIEDRIAELSDCASKQEAIRQKPPGDIKPDDGKPDQTKPDATKPDVTAVKPTVATTQDGTGDDDDTKISKGTERGEPHLLSLRLQGGAGKIAVGSEITVPIVPTGILNVGYPIRVNPQLRIEPGVAFGFSPIQYDNAMGASKTAQLYDLIVNLGLEYAVAPKIAIRVDLGAGASFFSGVSESPFTDNATTSGALAMFHARAGLSADYAVSPAFSVTLTPIAFGYTKPKDGLDSSIKQILELDFMVGIGYRM